MYDPDYIHCYPVSFDGLAPLQTPPLDSCTTITHVVPYGNSTFAQELPGSPIKAGGNVIIHPQLQSRHIYSLTISRVASFFLIKMCMTLLHRPWGLLRRLQR